MNHNYSKIGVTGVGGGVGQSIIKALQGSDFTVVAMDGDCTATGLYASSISYNIPYATSSDYIPRLLEICQYEKCKLLFSGLDAELSVLAENKDQFEKIGTRLIVSNKYLIRVADDKLETYRSLTTFGIAVPFTCELSELQIDNVLISYPIIVKPKTGGARSKGVFKVNSKDDLAQLLKREQFDTTNYIAQEYIEGDEYTCGSITLDGKCRGVIVMRRQLRDGDTYKCEVVFNEVIENTLFKLLEIFQPEGACNVQLRLRDGIPYVFEINARCSGSTAARALCGFNEPLSIANFYINSIEPELSVTQRTIYRYWKEIVIDPKLKSRLESEKYAFTNKHTLL